MNGIDIASYQAGLNVNDIAADFVIVKATQGSDYVNPCMQRHVEETIESGKLLGLYHYVDGSGCEGEARHFAQVASPYIGKAILCIDWESIQNAAWGNEGYLRVLINEVVGLTGVKPLIYASFSVFPWSVASDLDCGAWVAQYADNDPTGYQKSPWNEHRYNCAIRQYSSNGRLAGYDDGLDLNKAYMNRAQWAKYADPQGTQEAAPEPQKAAGLDALSTDDLVMRTFAGEFGNGDERRALLGDRYSEVQGRLNWCMRMADKTINGDFGNGDDRRRNLGDDYDIVQWMVNRMA